MKQTRQTWPVRQRGKSVETPAPVVAVQTTLPGNGSVKPKKILEVLQTLQQKCAVGDFRGWRRRPEILVTKGEMQALESAIAFIHSAMYGNGHLAKGE